MPPQGQFALNCRDAGVDFNTTTYERTVMLQNTSEITEHRFFLQAHPHEYFTCHPGFGKVPPGGSMNIRIVFTPNMQDPARASQRIRGWIRLRTWYGVTLQRVPLLAYNAPLLRTSTSSIDFGFCLHDSLHAGHASEAAVAVYGADDSDGADGTKTVSSLRCQIVRPLFVTNIGAIRSNCMLQMPSTTALKGAYSASPSFAVLEPGQVQRFDISFTPQSNKHYGKCPPFPFRLYSLHLPLS